MGPTKEPFKTQHEQLIEQQNAMFQKCEAQYEKAIAREGIDPHCPQCGADLLELDQNFCPYCALDMRAMKTTCRNCGHSNHSWAVPSRYKACCPMCGVPWDSDHTIAPEVEPFSSAEGRV